MGNCIKKCCDQNDDSTLEDKEVMPENQTIRPQYYFKILLVGDQSVGKSSLISRITSDEVPDSISPTMGVDFARKSLIVNDFVVKFHFWDPSGNQRFRELLPNYFSDTNAVLLMYDISREQTFTSCSDYWLPSIRANARPPPNLTMILGNKSDLSSDRAVSVTRGLCLANQTNSLFMEVSAKTGDNVENLLNTIGNQLIHIYQQRS